MAFDPDAYLAEGGGVKETPFDPDAYLGIEKPVGTSIGQEISQIPAALKQSFGQPLEAMGETAQVAGFPAVATALKGAIQEPEGYVSAGERFMAPKEGEFQIAGFAPQYAPRAVVEQTGQIIGSIGTRIAGAVAGGGLGALISPATGVAGAAVGQFAGPALFEAAQIVGPVALERAKNNGYTEPTDKDMAYAIATAAGSGLLNAFGAKYLPGGEKAVGSFAKRLAASFIGEGVPEGLQSFTQQVGETIETEKGIQVSPKQAIGEALIGGAAGAAATTIAAPFTPEQIAEAKITESANKEAENLFIGNDNPQGKAVLANKQKLEQEIADTKQVLSVIESTDPVAQKLKLELKEKEAILAKAQGQVDSIVESTNPVAEANRQQAELAKAIVEEPTPTVKESLTVQPTEAAPVAAPVEQVVTPPVEVAPTIAEPAPVEQIAPAPEAAAIDRYTELSRNPKIGTAKERKALEPTVATTTFQTSRGSTYYILPDGKIRRDKYSGTTSYSDQIAFVSPENAEKIKEIRNEYEEGKDTSVEITPEVIRFRFNEKTAEVPIASQSPQEGLSPFELSGGRYPHLGDPVVSPAPVTEQAAPAEAPAPEVAPAMPKEISDLYLEASGLRFTLNALQMQMGEKRLSGKSKAEFDNTKAKLDNIELKLSEYEKSKKDQLPSIPAKPKKEITQLFQDGETVEYYDDLFDKTQKVKILYKTGDGDNGTERYQIQFEDGKEASIWSNELKPITTPAVSETITEPVEPTPKVEQEIEVGDEASVNLAGRNETVTIARIEDINGVPTAYFDYFGYKSRPLAEMQLAKKSDRNIAQAKRKAEEASKVEEEVKELPAKNFSPSPKTSTAIESQETTNLRNKIKEAKGSDRKIVVMQAMAEGVFFPSAIEAAEFGKPFPSIDKTLSSNLPDELKDRIDTSKIKLSVIKSKSPEEAASKLISNDDERWILGGVYFDSTNNVVVATDGRALVAIPKKITGGDKVVAARNIKKTTYQEEIKKGQLIDGNYPNWKQVVPTYGNAVEKVDIDIDDALKSATILDSLNNTFNNKNEKSVINFKDARFDPVYILSSITTLVESGAKSITAQIKSKEDPLLLTGDNGAIAVIMPTKPNVAILHSLKAKSGKPKLGEKGRVLIPTKEDFIQAGQNIYEAGMEFGTWAKQMIQQFGDAVREFLGEVWQAVSGAPAKLNELMGYLPKKGEAGAVNVGQGENAPIKPEAKTVTEGLVQGIDIGKENNMPINNKIESHIKNFAFVRGIFESASDRLRRAKFTKLATAIDDYYDQAQRRLGFANKILLPAFEEYSKQSKATKAKIDEEVKMFFAAQENKRDTDEFFDELNPITQNIVTAWQKFGEESGKENQRIGIKVYDKGLQRWRPIGRIEKFWPRVLKPEYKRALMEPDKYQKEYNEIVEALMKSGRIETPEEAEVFISEYQGTGSQNDYFSGIEVARGQAFPEELYDYSTQVMTDYVARWAQHSSRIEQFGQKLGENSKTLWDRSRESTRDRRTIDYITAAQERVEGYFPNDPFVKGMSTLGIWTSGFQLGNFSSSMLNFFGGTTLNAMVGQPGALSSYLSSFIELRNLGRQLKDAREKGIVSRDLMNIIGDHQAMLEYNRFAQAGQKTTDFLLKYSGFTPVEQMVRTQSMIIGKSFLRKTLSSLSKNPNSSFSKRSLAWLNRNNIDADKLIVEQGTGPETDKLLRYFANISQGSYTIAQTPIFIDTPIGRFLFKYQKFSTQMMRQSWKNTFEPAWKAVTNKNETLQLPEPTRQLLYRLRLAEAKELGDNRKITLDEIPKKVTKAEGKALTIIPVMMWLGSAYVGGEVILRFRDMLFGVLMKGPSYEDIIRAFEDDEDDDELYLALERAWYNLIGMGALGLIGNYAQFFMDLQDRERVKNPLDPPALSIVKETGTFFQNFVDQGKITLGDINDYLNRTLSAYRVAQRAYQTAASGLGFSKAPTVAEEMFRREVASINKYARRWAESAGLEYRTRRPSDLPTSKMTPINRKIASYLQRGEPGAAVAYAKEYLNSIPKKDREKAIQSMESGARFRKPFRLGNGPMNESEKTAFRKWLKEKVSKEDFDKFQKLDSSYQKTYNLFLNGLPNK